MSSVVQINPFNFNYTKKSSVDLEESFLKLISGRTPTNLPKVSDDLWSRYLDPCSNLDLKVYLREGKAYLSGRNIELSSETGLVSFIKYISENCTELGLSHFSFRDDNFDIWTRFVAQLRNIPNLEKLSFSRCGLEGRHAKVLINVLDPKKLENLDLSYNDIDQSAANRLLDYFEFTNIRLNQNPQLKNCSAYPEFIDSISEPFKSKIRKVTEEAFEQGSRKRRKLSDSSLQPTVENSDLVVPSKKERCEGAKETPLTKKLLRKITNEKSELVSLESINWVKLIGDYSSVLHPKYQGQGAFKFIIDNKLPIGILALPEGPITFGEDRVINHLKADIPAGMKKMLYIMRFPNKNSAVIRYSPLLKNNIFDDKYLLKTEHQELPSSKKGKEKESVDREVDGCDDDAEDSLINMYKNALLNSNPQEFLDLLSVGFVFDETNSVNNLFEMIRNELFVNKENEPQTIKDFDFHGNLPKTESEIFKAYTERLALMGSHVEIHLLTGTNPAKIVDSILEAQPRNIFGRSEETTSDQWVYVYATTEKVNGVKVRVYRLMHPVGNMDDLIPFNVISTREIEEE